MTASATIPGVRTRALVVALLAAIATGLTAWVALDTLLGQRIDYAGYFAVVIDSGGRTDVLSVLGQVGVGGIVVLMAACVVVALLRGSWRAAIGAVVVIAGSNVTTQLLKHVVLERADVGLWVGQNSLPSGHTTVIASGFGAIFLVTPRRLRPFLALIAAAAITFVGSSTVVAGWHRPADVPTAFGVSLAWTALAAAFVGGRRRSSGASVLPALAGAGLAGVVLLVVGVRPAYGWSGIVDAVLVHGILALTAVVLVVVLEWVTPSAPQTFVSRRPGRGRTAAAEPSPVGVARTAGTADGASALHP